MMVNSMARRLTPMVILSACLFSGCQSVQSVGSEPLAFAAATTFDERDDRTSHRVIQRALVQRNTSPSDVPEWRERAQKMREAFRERREKRRAERRKNTVATRAILDNEAPRRSNRDLHIHDNDDRTSRWRTFRLRKPETKSATVNPTVVKPQGRFGTLIAKYAKQHGVPVRLARAVVQVESTFRPNVTGGAGEIGLMQIKYATAKGMGYKGSRKQLYDPATNLYWGMKYLGRAHQLAGGSTCGTILRYNAGHYAKRMNPISSRYCRKVQGILA